MPRPMTPRPHADLKRLFVRAGLTAGAEVDLDPGQVNYLVIVLRMHEGDRILVFNTGAAQKYPEAICEKLPRIDIKKPIDWASI